MKRLCIYLTYDKQNIVDEYIGYMLKELKTCVSHLVVVCNQLELVSGQDILEYYADQIFFRENKGFDAGGFKDVLCNLLGWNEVFKYDELILINDSFFGPFCPMKKIFTEMESKKVDFWGLIQLGECSGTAIGVIPRHVQSFFIAIQSRLLHNKCFQAYWNDMPYYCFFDEVIREHEIRFTEYFAKLGFTYATLADTSSNDSFNTENNFSQYAYLSNELIRKRNFPFLKKQQIIYDNLLQQTQENLRQAIEYIDKYTDYDVKMIWDNLIRTMNISDLQKNLCLQYIISRNDVAVTDCTRKVCIAVFASHQNACEYVIEYLKNLKQYYRIIIFSSQDVLLKSYEENGFECRLHDSENDFTRLLSALDGNDYVCAIHDEDMSSDIKPSYIGKSHFYSVWCNLIKDDVHVRNIIERFEMESKLGYLTGQKANFSRYFSDYGKNWAENYWQVEEVVEKGNLQCVLSEAIPPFAVSNDFWIRGNVLKSLQRLVNCDKDIMKYLWIYLVQDAGFYSGIVESEEYASMNEVNTQYYLERICTQIRNQYGEFEDFLELKKKISQGVIQIFCSKYKRIFIYGAGYIAKRYANILPDIEAYIVTDGQANVGEIDGIKVLYLSQLVPDDNMGIVICLNEKHRMQVIPLLEQKGYKNYIFV